MGRKYPERSVGKTPGALFFIRSRAALSQEVMPSGAGPDFLC